MVWVWVWVWVLWAWACVAPGEVRCSVVDSFVGSILTDLRGEVPNLRRAARPCALKLNLCPNLTKPTLSKWAVSPSRPLSSKTKPAP